MAIDHVKCINSLKCIKYLSGHIFWWAVCHTIIVILSHLLKLPLIYSRYIQCTPNLFVRSWVRSLLRCFVSFVCSFVRLFFSSFFRLSVSSILRFFVITYVRLFASQLTITLHVMLVDNVSRTVLPNVNRTFFGKFSLRSANVTRNVSI